MATTTWRAAYRPAVVRTVQPPSSGATAVTATAVRSGTGKEAAYPSRKRTISRLSMKPSGSGPAYR